MRTDFAIGVDGAADDVGPEGCRYDKIVNNRVRRPLPASPFAIPRLNDFPLDHGENARLLKLRTTDQEAWKRVASLPDHIAQRVGTGEWDMNQKDVVNFIRRRCFLGKVSLF